jgi:ribosomal protein S18 acetylase RimI-like enzyme
MLAIRSFADSDWPVIWPILRETFATGESYPFGPEHGEEFIRAAWTQAPAATFVATDGDRIVGTYFIKANQVGLGSHVSNCGYVVAPSAAGKGVASAMCEHSQQWAIEHGFRAMQFNFVVATNERAVRLWRRLGFEIVGTLPGAFRHRTLGFVDALVMYKTLYHPAS